MIDYIKVDFEIEQIRYTVRKAIAEHNNEIQKAVAHGLLENLNSDLFQHKIHEALGRCVDEAIEHIGNNWQLKQAVEELVSERIVEIVKGRKDGT